MDKKNHQKTLRAAVLAVALAIIGSPSPWLRAADTNVVSNAQKKPAPKKLTGAELYAIHCNRCHSERYPTEWNSREWKTLMTHMRVRANLPAGQAREILKYLTEESGNQ